MKRTFSIILVAILVVACTLALVGCGSEIATEEEWNNAMEAFKTADAVTLTIKDENKKYKGGIFDSHVKYDITVTFDAELGVVAITRKSKSYNILGISSGDTTRYMYFVLDGTNVIYYRKNVSDYSDEWQARSTQEFDTVDEAMEYLRQLYITPSSSIYEYGEDYFPTFTDLEYYNFKVNNWGKFEYETTIDSRVHSYTLNFSSGKPSKFTYDTNVTDGLDDWEKYSVSIKYSAKITLPDDLPTEDFYS